MGIRGVCAGQKISLKGGQVASETKGKVSRLGLSIFGGEPLRRAGGSKAGYLSSLLTSPANLDIIFLKRKPSRYIVTFNP
jgi:hypothetical protein